MDQPRTPALDALARTGHDLPHRIVRTSLPDSPEQSAELQGIPLEALLRTIVVRRGSGDYLLALVPAGRRLDWRKLRAHLGVSRIALPDADEARSATGYERFTITPLGASHPWPVIADASMLEQPVVSIGGGMRGVNVHLAPADLARYLRAEVVDLTAAAG